MDNLPITITINWQQGDEDPERQERQTETLYRELRQMDEVDDVQRVPDPNCPDGGMGEGWLMNALKAEVSLENIGVVYRVIRDRIPGPPIEFKIDKESVEAKGVRPEDLDETLEKLVAAAKSLRED